MSHLAGDIRCVDPYLVGTVVEQTLCGRIEWSGARFSCGLAYTLPQQQRKSDERDEDESGAWTLDMAPLRLASSPVPQVRQVLQHRLHRAQSYVGLLWSIAGT